jgi:hypothetical protein
MPSALLLAVARSELPMALELSCFRGPLSIRLSCSSIVHCDTETAASNQHASMFWLLLASSTVKVSKQVLWLGAFCKAAAFRTRLAVAGHSTLGALFRSTPSQFPTIVNKKRK